MLHWYNKTSEKYEQIPYHHPGTQLNKIVEKIRLNDNYHVAVMKSNKVLQYSD